MKTRRILFAVFVALAMTPLFAAEPGGARKIHFIVGPSNHPPGTHKVAAAARLLKHCVEQTRPNDSLQTMIHDGWPENPEEFAGARVIVFHGDQFPPVRFKNTAAILEQLTRLADQGSSFVAVHYAIGVNRPAADSVPVQAVLDRFFGGFASFIPVAEGGTVPRVMEASITPTKSDHPVLRGVKPFFPARRTALQEPIRGQITGQHRHASGHGDGPTRGAAERGCRLEHRAQRRRQGSRDRNASFLSQLAK